jgi:hypothetical protein
MHTQEGRQQWQQAATNRTQASKPMVSRIAVLPAAVQPVHWQPQQQQQHQLKA